MRRDAVSRGSGAAPSKAAQIARLASTGDRRRWSVVVVLALAAAIVEMVGALLMLTLISAIAAPGRRIAIPIIGDPRRFFAEMTNERFLVTLASLVTLFFVFRGLFFLVERYVQNRVAQNAGVRLATRLFRGYLCMPYNLHLQRNSAEVIRNIQGATVQIVNSIFTPLALTVSEALLIIGILIALLIAAPLETGAAIVVLVPLIALMLRFLYPRMTAFGEITNTEGKITVQAIQESMQNAREVKVFGRETFFERRFELSRARLARAVYLRAVLAELPRVLTETLLITFILLFVIIAVNAGRPLSETLSIVGLFAYAALRMLPSINKLVGHLNNFRYGRPSVELVSTELADIEEVLPGSSGTDQKVPLKNDLVVENVTFQFAPDAPPVLRNVSFVMSRGEVVGIAGRTGAGKSTLADVIMALLVPTKGNVTADGRSIHDNPAGWHRNLGIVPQSILLLDDTIAKNIAFGLESEVIDHQRLSHVARLSHLDEFLMSLPEGMETVVGERGIRLSGGQRQRIAIARALYHDPEFLIFDEATSALDTATESQIIDELTRLHDRTILMIAHRISTLSTTNKIIILEDGTIDTIGTYDELRKSSDLFRSASS